MKHAEDTTCHTHTILHTLYAEARHEGRLGEYTVGEEVTRHGHAARHTNMHARRGIEKVSSAFLPQMFKTFPARDFSGGTRAKTQMPAASMPNVPACSPPVGTARARPRFKEIQLKEDGTAEGEE